LADAGGHGVGRPRAAHIRHDGAAYAARCVQREVAHIHPGHGLRKEDREVDAVGRGRVRVETCDGEDGRARLNATLEDYAAVALGLVALYEAAFDLRWLQAADGLAQVILSRFSDPHGAGFFQTSDDHERLVARRKDFVDSAVPSGNSLAAELFLRLGVLLGRPDYADHATGIMQLMADAMGAQPAAFGRLLCALDFHLHPGHEIALVGDPAAEDTRALLAEVHRHYLPNSVLALRRPDDETAASLTPLLADRHPVDGRATAFVCRDAVCRLPFTDPSALAESIDR
jgi:uncharacterized protein